MVQVWTHVRPFVLRCRQTGGTGTVAVCRPKIVIAGDVCVDWVHWEVGAADQGMNWQLYPGMHWAAFPGEALLLAKMLRNTERVDVRAPDIADLVNSSPEETIHSCVALDCFPPRAGSSPGNKVYRIAHFQGYTGHSHGHQQIRSVQNDDAAPDLVVLDDSGNGFRDSPSAWPETLGQASVRPCSPDVDPLEPSSRCPDDTFDTLIKRGRRHRVYLPWCDRCRKRRRNAL